MPTNERSVSDVFQDIIRNVQEIVRSEVRLAKTEVRDEATKAKSAGLLLAVGALTASFALLFSLLAIVYALTIVMPNWAAALIVAVALSIAAGGTLTAGRQRFQKLYPTPKRTVESLKENVEWVKQQIK